MTLSDGEKLILVMLTEIYEKLGIKGEVDPNFIKSAIFRGNLWGLKWEYHGLFHDEDTPEEVAEEAGSILTMWSCLEDSFAALSAADQARVQADAEPYGDPVFPGFDGNNEAEHYSCASFMVEDMGRFQEFQGRDLNSHAPLLDGYRRMLHAFEPALQAHAPRTMSADRIIEMLRSQALPEIDL